MSEYFWDIKARKYPKAEDENNIKNFNLICEKLEKQKIFFDNKKIIDIGCGPGNYSLLMAKTAKEVFCLDISAEMLSFLECEAVNSDKKNISWKRSSFEKWDSKDKKKYFEISFASMTPAVKTEEDILRMEYVTAEHCVFIGWAGKRENKIYEEICGLYGISPHSPKGFMDVKKILEKNKRNFYSEVYEEDFYWEGSLEEASKELLAKIRLDLPDAKEHLIIDFLEKKFSSNRVLMETKALKGILIWNPS